MKCLKCGNKLDRGQKFCEACGEEYIVPEGFIDDDELLNAFIGKKANKIRHSKVSLGMFFFGAFYALYRKMYGCFGILLVISAIISLLSKLVSPYFLLLNVIFYIVLLFIGNSLYLSFAKKEVEMLKKKYAGASYEELLEHAKKAGGVNNWVIPVIAVVFILSIVGGIIYGVYIAIEEIITPVIYKYEDISFSIPGYWEIEDGNTYYTDDCAIAITHIDGEYSSDDLHELYEYSYSGKVDFYNGYKTIGGRKWNYLSYYEDFSYNYVYVISDNNKTYFIAQVESNHDECEEEFREMIRSVNFKK